MVGIIQEFKMGVNKYTHGQPLSKEEAGALIKIMTVVFTFAVILIMVWGAIPFYNNIANAKSPTPEGPKITPIPEVKEVAIAAGAGLASANSAAAGSTPPEYSDEYAKNPKVKWDWREDKTAIAPAEPTDPDKKIVNGRTWLKQCALNDEKGRKCYFYKYIDLGPQSEVSASSDNSKNRESTTTRTPTPSPTQGQEKTQPISNQWYLITDKAYRNGGETFQYNGMDITIKVDPSDFESSGGTDVFIPSAEDRTKLFNSEKKLIVKMKFQIRGTNEIFVTPTTSYSGTSSFATMPGWQKALKEQGKNLQPSDIEWQPEFGLINRYND